MDASKIAKIGLVLTICALIFQVTALATPYWVFIESGGNKAFSGLWKTCFYYRIGTLYRRDCIAFTDVKDWFIAVRATSISGCLSILGALVMIILKMFVYKDKKPIMFLAIGSDFFGSILILISIAVFATNADELPWVTSSDINFSFAFCIVAMLAALGAGAVMMLGAIRT